MKHDEYSLQKQICGYLNIQYPRVLYISDTIGSVKLTMGQAVRNKAIQKSGFACPDLLIFYPSGVYHGLFIELKKESPFKKDGSLYKNEHLEQQDDSINKLNNLGYKSMFCWSFEMAKKEIDNYMSGMFGLIK